MCEKEFLLSRYADGNGYICTNNTRPPEEKLLESNTGGLKWVENGDFFF